MVQTGTLVCRIGLAPCIVYNLYRLTNDLMPDNPQGLSIKPNKNRTERNLGHLILSSLIFVGLSIVDKIINPQVSYE